MPKQSQHRTEDEVDFAAHERALLASILRDSFADFVAWAWPLVTNRPYVANAIAERIIATLQRVATGELDRVLIACPPGVGKSTLLACYSAWRLARNPGHRSIHAGHAFEGLAKTESLRVRRLVEHDEYRRLFPVGMRADENTAGVWATTTNGIYIALGTDGGTTGKRVSEAVLDDPLDAADRFSQAAKHKLWTWFTESLLSRLDGDRAPIVVVHQRLDRDDLIGKLLEAGGDWHLVEIPAELEDGTLLAPNVLSREKLDTLKLGMGSAAYACQFLQRPSDDSSARVKRAWWNFHRPRHVDDMTPRPSGCDTTRPVALTPETFDALVIAVDMTFGGLKQSNDYAVVQAWGAKGSGRYLLRQWRKKATQLEQREAIRAMRRDYPMAPIIVEQAAGGQGAVEILRAEGFTAVIGVTTGGKSKDQRLGLVTPSIEAGDCFLPLGAPWLADLIEEMAGATKHDDAQDAAAYALAHFALQLQAIEQNHGGYASAAGDDDEHRHPFSHGPSSFDYSVDPYGGR